jgi:hypothetical protein
MLPTTENWGLRDPLRVVYYHFRRGRYFSHSVAELAEDMLFRQVKILCYAAKGNARGQRARIVKRHGRCPQRPGQGILSERGWRRWVGNDGKGKVV